MMAASLLTPSGQPLAGSQAPPDPLTMFYSFVICGFCLIRVIRVYPRFKIVCGCCFFALCGFSAASARQRLLLKVFLYA
jgi:hypothetical protein